MEGKPGGRRGTRRPGSVVLALGFTQTTTRRGDDDAASGDLPTALPVKTTNHVRPFMHTQCPADATQNPTPINTPPLTSKISVSATCCLPTSTYYQLYMLYVLYNCSVSTLILPPIYNLTHRRIQITILIISNKQHQICYEMQKGCSLVVTKISVASVWVRLPMGASIYGFNGFVLSAQATFPSLTRCMGAM